MIYAMSDLHGRYDLYAKMLEKIRFSKADTLYILGDCVDRGEEGLKIVLDIAEIDNVIPLMGNHDLTALSILSNLNRALQPSEMGCLNALIDLWLMDGGRETYHEYKSLSLQEQKLSLMTLDRFKNYAVVKVRGCEFVLCHGGIKGYHPEKPLFDYTVDDFAVAREDYTKPKFGVRGKYLVTGHTPTSTIEGAVEGKIYKKHDHIAIDCGAVFGYRLGCIRLDDMKEFYVQ